jgi:hypothetical protein
MQGSIDFYEIEDDRTNNKEDRRDRRYRRERL